MILFNNESPYSAILESITYINNVFARIRWLRSDQNVMYQHVWTYIAYIVYVCDTLQNGGIGWHGGD